MKQKDNAAKKKPAPFTEMAGAGDELTPDAFREETDELLRQKVARRSRNRTTKPPDEKRPATKSPDTPE